MEAAIVQQGQAQKRKRGIGMIPLIGFGPDLDPMTPGVLVDTDGIIPTLRGFKPEPAAEPYAEALPAVVVGSHQARYLDGTERIIAATSSNVYDFNAGGAKNSIGSGYSASGRWRFTMFGNDLIATDFDDVIQVASGAAGTLAALSGSPPRARIVEACNDFVFALATNTAENQVHWSGIGNATTWTPDVATQAGRKTLDWTPGGIKAGKSLDTDIVIYKLRSMYVGRYVGPPVLWSFDLVSDIVGTYSQEAVVNLGDRHVFPGNDDFYVFDGVRPQPLSSPVREFVFREDLDENNASTFIGRYDRRNKVVSWHYSSANADPAGTIDTQISWHVVSNRWTLTRRTIEYVMMPELVSRVGMTYDEFGSYWTNFGDAIDVPYEAAIFRGSNVAIQGIFDTSHALNSLTGTPGATHLTTGDVGDDTRFAYVTRVKPKFATYPTGTATMRHDYRTNLGDSVTQGPSTTTLATQGWFNTRRRARFHRFRFDLTGDYEIIGFKPIIMGAGRR